MVAIGKETIATRVGDGVGVVVGIGVGVGVGVGSIVAVAVAVGVNRRGWCNRRGKLLAWVKVLVFLLAAEVRSSLWPSPHFRGRASHILPRSFAER